MSVDKPASFQEEIVFMEAQTWEALKGSGKSLVPFLTDDCVMIFPGASIFDHASKPTLREILNRPDVKPWSRYEMDEVRVVRLGPDAAMICYSVEAYRDETAYEALITSVWRRDSKQGPDWKMALHQQTPIAV